MRSPLQTQRLIMSLSRALFRHAASLLSLAGSLSTLNWSVQATVLDNFNDNTKTDWKDDGFGVGQSTEVNGQLKFEIPAAGQPLFFASSKTSQTFTLQDKRTIEFRVDLISGNSKDSFAILSWIPNSSKVTDLAGYSIAKSPTDILVSKGINKYFYNEDPTPAVKNENVTLVLSLTGAGSSVVINAKVLDKDNSNAVLFDKTFVDTAAADELKDGKDDPAAAYTGPGHFVLMEYEDYAAGGPDVYEVVLDNAEAFVLDHTLLDDFNDNTKSDWKDDGFGVGKSTEVNGQFKFEIPAAGQPLFFASSKTSRTFDVVDGQKIEFSVDLISGNSKDSFAILSWIPTSAKVTSLAGYSIAKSPTDVLITKGINKYFYSEDPTPPLKNENVTLVLSLTGSGPNVVINAKVLDKEDNNAVLFERTFVDTPAADLLKDGTDDPAVPYTRSGNFFLMEYEDFAAGGPDVYEVILDNAQAAAPPIAGNVPPVWSDVQPEEFANFLPATTQVSFKVSDDKPIADNQITVTLNGVLFTSTNGLVLSPAGATRTGTLGGLTPNSNYEAKLQVVDSDGVTNITTLSFDTFLPTDFVIEAEDYNFGGGQFIDNPVLISEGTGPQANSYQGQVGVAETDFHDTRANPNNYPYRPEDPVGTKRTLDTVRQKFTAAGGAASGIYDYDIGELAAGEFLNYTRTFTPGSYEVYLRESLFNTGRAEAILEQLTGSAAQPTVTVLGSFLGFTSGSKFRNVPLTDALGQKKVVVKLAGAQTLRLRQATSDPSDGNIYQNYLIFVPVADAGLQRAAVTELTPAAGATVETIAPVLTVKLQNRDTTVKTNSIVLTLNGSKVAPLITADAKGATVTYPIDPLPLAGTTNTASIVFADSDSVLQTNQWTFVLNYKSLKAANARPGPGQNPGFAVRVVQAPQGTEGLENSLGRAESQLAANSPIPVFYSTNVVAPVINFSQGGPDSADGYFPADLLIPGLQPEVNGTDDIAMEILTYLDLSAGAHRFGVRCDDGYKIVSGTSLTDNTTPALAFHNGGAADETVDFLVPKSGLYPFRMIWYERGGGAHVEWFSVNPETGERTLINDGTAAGSIKAYVSVAASTSLEVLSASRITGPFAADSTALIDAAARTVTIPISGAAGFFRLRASGTVVTIGTIKLSGKNLTISYSVSPP
jgi:hypothetical protein